MIKKYEIFIFIFALFCCLAVIMIIIKERKSNGQKEKKIEEYGKKVFLNFFLLFIEITNKG